VEDPRCGGPNNQERDQKFFFFFKWYTFFFSLFTGCTERSKVLSFQQCASNRKMDNSSEWKHLLCWPSMNKWLNITLLAVMCKNFSLPIAFFLRKPCRGCSQLTSFLRQKHHCVLAVIVSTQKHNNTFSLQVKVRQSVHPSFGSTFYIYFQSIPRSNLINTE
jgi:hypothetical protein